MLCILIYKKLSQREPFFFINFPQETDKSVAVFTHQQLGLPRRGRGWSACRRAATACSLERRNHPRRVPLPRAHSALRCLPHWHAPVFSAARGAHPPGLVQLAVTRLRNHNTHGQCSPERRLSYPLLCLWHASNERRLRITPWQPRGADA